MAPTTTKDKGESKTNGTSHTKKTRVVKLPKDVNTSINKVSPDILAKTKVPAGELAGLVLRIARNTTYAKTISSQHTWTKRSMVVQAGVLEYLLDQMLQASAEACENMKRKTVDNQHVHLAIEHDEDLRSIFTVYIAYQGIPDDYQQKVNARTEQNKVKEELKDERKEARDTAEKKKKKEKKEKKAAKEAEKAAKKAAKKEKKSKKKDSSESEEEKKASSGDEKEKKKEKKKDKGEKRKKDESESDSEEKLKKTDSSSKKGKDKEEETDKDDDAMEEDKPKKKEEKKEKSSSSHKKSKKSSD